MVRHLLLFYVYDIFDEWKARKALPLPQTSKEIEMKHPRTTHFGAGMSLAQMATAAPRANKINIDHRRVPLSITAGHLPPGAPRTNKAIVGVDKAGVLRTDQDEPANGTPMITIKSPGCSC